MKKLNKESKASYVGIVMAVGSSRFSKGHLHISMIAEAIARGVGLELHSLIDELEGIESRETAKEEALRIRDESEYEYDEAQRN